MDSPVASRLRKRAPAEAKEKKDTVEEKSGKKERKTAAKKSKVAPVDAWREIAAILDPSGGAAEEVALAVQRPAEYDARFPTRLENRGMDTIKDGVVHALIDALQARKLCFIADRHTSFPEFVEHVLEVAPAAMRTNKAIARLKKDLADELKNTDDRYDEGPVSEVTKYVQEAGYTPLCICNDSDQLQFVVALPGPAKRVVELAQQVKCDINEGLY